MASKASRRVLLGAAAALAAALLLAPIHVLEIALDGTGLLLWRVPVGSGASVEFVYTNSIYNAATTERFVVEGQALRLVEVSSTQEAVLEYMRVDAYDLQAGRYVARTRGPRLTTFTTRIGQTGQQRLRVDGREIPLYQVGVGEAVTVTLARIRRVRLLVERPLAP